MNIFACLGRKGFFSVDAFHCLGPKRVFSLPFSHAFKNQPNKSFFMAKHRRMKRSGKHHHKKWDFVSPVGAAVGTGLAFGAVGKTPALLKGMAGIKI